MTDYELIRNTITPDDMLCQLAEEAAELAQAALKLRRAVGGTNPTPVTRNEATKELITEIADTAVAVKVYLACDAAVEIDDVIKRIMSRKTARWVERLSAKENTNDKD